MASIALGLQTKFTHRVCNGILTPAKRPENRGVVRILGLDPGSRNTGYGVIELSSSGGIVHVGHGTLSCAATEGFAQRMGKIGHGLVNVFEEFQPQVTVLEKIFLGKNADSAFKLGHARGVCLFQAVSAGSEIAEYAARSVKKGVTGSGGASKEHVRLMVGNFLKLRESIQIDASDALALAIHHAMKIQVQARVRDRGISL